MGIVLKNGNLIDGTGKVVKDAVVVIEGSTITAAGKAAEVKLPEGKQQIIDVAGKTIMPGLIDLHVHLWFDSSEFAMEGGAAHDRFGESVTLATGPDAYLAIHMAESAKRTLAAGFTTVRDTGSPRDMAIDIARAARDGLFVGPRILACATVDMTFPPGKKQVHFTEGGNITGPVEAARAVRVKIGDGADWLHLMVTGAALGFWGAEDNMLTFEEVLAATEAAHRLRRPVTANACGVEGMKNALRAGVDCIEHGTHIAEDEDVIKMMLDRRVPWTPTLYVYCAKKEAADAAAARGESLAMADYWLQREFELIDFTRRGFEKAMEAGVLSPLGTDSGAFGMPHGKNAKEMEMYVRYGASEMEAIVAATSWAAEALGMKDRLGTVEAGKEADLIVVKKDPLKDIKILQDNANVELVIMGGEIVVDGRGQSHGVV